MLGGKDGGLEFFLGGGGGLWGGEEEGSVGAGKVEIGEIEKYSISEPVFI